MTDVDIINREIKDLQYNMNNLYSEIYSLDDLIGIDKKELSDLSTEIKEMEESINNSSDTESKEFNDIQMGIQALNATIEELGKEIKSSYAEISAIQNIISELHDYKNILVKKVKDIDGDVFISE
jgi:chromosome segregation ATPase